MKSNQMKILTRTESVISRKTLDSRVTRPPYYPSKQIINSTSIVKSGALHLALR